MRHTNTHCDPCSVTSASKQRHWIRSIWTSALATWSRRTPRYRSTNMNSAPTNYPGTGQPSEVHAKVGGLRGDTVDIDDAMRTAEDQVRSIGKRLQETTGAENKTDLARKVFNDVSSRSKLDTWLGLGKRISAPRPGDPKAEKLLEAVGRELGEDAERLLNDAWRTIRANRSANHTRNTRKAHTADSEDRMNAGTPRYAGRTNKD